MEDFEARVVKARVATLELYLDDPTPEGARLMVVFEETVKSLRYQRAEKDTRPELPKDQGDNAN